MNEGISELWKYDVSEAIGEIFSIIDNNQCPKKNDCQSKSMEGEHISPTFTFIFMSSSVTVQSSQLC